MTVSRSAREQESQESEVKMARESRHVDRPVDRMHATTGEGLASVNGRQGSSAAHRRQRQTSSADRMACDDGAGGLLFLLLGL